MRSPRLSAGVSGKVGRSTARAAYAERNHNTMPRFSGAFAPAVTSGGISARQAEITAGPLNPTVPAGTPGALVAGIHGAIAAKLITVIDLGRGHVTPFLQSSNNRTRILAALGGLNATHYRLGIAPGEANARSASLELSKVVSGQGSAITGTVSAYDPGESDDGNGNMVPNPDNRSDLDLALAAEWEPSAPTFTLQSAIDRIMNIMHAAGTEAFIMADEQEQELRVFPVADTSTSSAFQTAGGVASLDANSFVGVYSVPEIQATVAGGSQFIG